MGIIIEFPAHAAARQPGRVLFGAADEGLGTVLILPVIRIDRDSTDGTDGGRGPEQGAASGRRRRRRP